MQRITEPQQIRLWPETILIVSEGYAGNLDEGRPSNTSHANAAHRARESTSDFESNSGSLTPLSLTRQRIRDDTRKVGLVVRMGAGLRLAWLTGAANDSLMHLVRARGRASA